MPVVVPVVPSVLGEPEAGPDVVPLGAARDGSVVGACDVCPMADEFNAIAPQNEAAANAPIAFFIIGTSTIWGSNSF